MELTKDLIRETLHKMFYGKQKEFIAQIGEDLYRVEAPNITMFMNGKGVEELNKAMKEEGERFLKDMK